MSSPFTWMRSAICTQGRIQGASASRMPAQVLASEIVRWADGTVWMMGGGTLPGTGMTYLDTMWEVNPETGAWVDTGVKLPIPLRMFGAVTLPDNDTLVIVGGETTGEVKQSAVYSYSRRFKKWSQRGSLAVGWSSGVALVTSQGHVRLVHGGTTTDSYLLAPIQINTVTWVASSLSPHSRTSWWPTISRLNSGHFLIAGGHSGGGSNKLSRYDPATDTWQALPDMPVAFSQGSSTDEIDGKVYIFTPTGQVLVHTVATGVTVTEPTGLSHGTFCSPVVTLEDKSSLIFGSNTAADRRIIRHTP